MTMMEMNNTGGKLAACILLLIVNSQAKPVSNDDETSRLDIYVNAGANIELQSGVKVYVDTMELTFVIPDIPDLPILSPGIKCDLLWCRTASETNVVVQETKRVLEVFQKMFTFKGINISKADSFSKNHSVTINDVVADNKIAVAKAGVDWYAFAKHALEDRRHGTDDHNNSRVRRSIIGKAGVMLAPILLKQMKHLFVPDAKILPFLTNVRASVSKSLKTFTNFPIFESLFSSVGRNSYTKLQTANTLFNRFYQKDIVQTRKFTSRNDFIRSVQKSEENIFNLGNLVHSVLRTVGHLSALLDCRNNKIPLLFVPPEMLLERLNELDQNLQNELESVFKADETLSYYNLKSAECKFDNDGGIVQVQAYLKPKLSDYRLYEFQSLAFAWYNYTCDLGISSTYVVREEQSGMIFPISDVDEENCAPKSSGICRVPQAANADVPHHYCLITMMQGGSTSEVKAACPLTCRPGTRITTTQVKPDQFVVAHLPKAGAKVKCDDGYAEPVFHNVDVGSIRIILQCGCSLIYKGKIVATSIQKFCAYLPTRFHIDHVLPIQVSTLEEWIPSIDESFKEVKFKAHALLVDTQWRPVVQNEMVEQAMISYTFPIWSLLMSVFQWVGIMLIFFKYRMGPFAFLNGISRQIRNVQAGNFGRTCDFPSDVYFLLYVLLGLVCLIILPSWICFIVSKCKNTLKRAVENAAEKKLFVRALNQVDA